MAVMMWGGPDSGDYFRSPAVRLVDDLAATWFWARFWYAHRYVPGPHAVAAELSDSGRAGIVWPLFSLAGSATGGVLLESSNRFG